MILTGDLVILPLTQREAAAILVATERADPDVPATLAAALDAARVRLMRLVAAAYAAESDEACRMARP